MIFLILNKENSAAEVECLRLTTRVSGCKCETFGCNCKIVCNKEHTVGRVPVR